MSLAAFVGVVDEAASVAVDKYAVVVLVTDEVAVAEYAVVVASFLEAVVERQQLGVADFQVEMASVHYLEFDSQELARFGSGYGVVLVWIGGCWHLLGFEYYQAYG